MNKPFRAGMLAGILTCLLLAVFAGCPSPRPPVPPAPVHQPGQPTPPPPNVLPKGVQDLDAQIADLKGQLAAKEQQRQTALLAPVREALIWAEVIAGLVAALGVGLAVACTIWNLGFARKIPLGIAGCAAGVLGTCLFLGSALDHVTLLVGLAVGVLALLVLWAIGHHLNVVAAARKAWDAVPDDKDLGTKAEALLGRMERKIDPRDAR